MVRNLLLGTENWEFLGSVALRTAVMFIVILAGLRVMGKRGVKHLSVFELGVIVGLGSAAGDPMFYRDVGLLPCLVVFGVVLSLYRALELVMSRSSSTAERLEGSPVEILRDGELVPHAIEDIELTLPEVLAALRLRGISHLGQVERAIVEPNGEVSVFFADDEHVRAGLPTIPALYEDRISTISTRGLYSCTACGRTLELAPGTPPSCPSCHHDEWTRARAERRVT